MTTVRTLLAAASFLALSGAAVAAPAGAPVRAIVLVHGAFADGSGWQPVAEILRKDGYTVSVVQEPETSLADDVAATNRILDHQTGPAVLVGHSYGGAIITEAGNNAHVASLVYVAAFAPDEGERLGPLTGSNPPASNSIVPIGDGYLEVDPAQFPADFAADVPAAEAQFMAISQVPIKADIFGTPITAAAWKTKPSYAVVATQDRMINPALERTMYKRAGAKVTEITGSHAVFVSQPRLVADVIERAARDAG
ncbi:alpha/beta fold hydrolase [Novosphingobium sp. FSW06-99]|uniref:alpha/beta fold hydrolase n=1 Tax=Novosphingobium sp. FSW06-99 TaxID=1739113 RepID=UPI00076BEECC|nr:alpha/beta hydrolase [Novosphingobium sp. FSW06-99]KUR74989.1 hydrolase [Novosphingobium sp. FSW06-99]